MSKKTPQMRICVTPRCNLHCVYCTPEGEGYAENPNESMGREEINQIIKTSVAVGFTHFKFTGGEPLLRSDMVDIISDTRQISGVQEIQMVTNGTLLERHAESLKSAGLTSVTISIDAANPETYKQIRGGKLQLVLASLRKCQQINLPVRINTVLMKKNLGEVMPLIDLAHEAGASLKFLDLMDLDRVDGSYDFWKEEYYPFDQLVRWLEDKGGKFVGLEETPGGVGAPCLEYRMPNGLQVVLKDSVRGTFYADYCATCPLFPCQDALISLRITHDGHLKMCLARNDNLLDILTPLRDRDLSKVNDRLKDRFEILSGSVFYPYKWKPRL
ncbi:MAG: radical SAM protein [Chloroflexi bacterium]|nr:radical SAM protein [Chloroflexota bacterium]